jgi:hypothetical protein
MEPFIQELVVVEDRRDRRENGLLEAGASMLLYCGCGQPLWCKVLPKGAGRVAVVCSTTSRRATAGSGMGRRYVV